MFYTFFIKRPIFAIVISLLMLTFGTLAIFVLPIKQYPDVSPPVVGVSSVYTGGDAFTVESSVTNILEEAINGVEGMLYMSSTSSNSGQSAIQIYFDYGYDQDIAAVDVQNAISLAEARLPQEVRDLGIAVQKSSEDFLFIVHLIDPTGKHDIDFLNNYASVYLLDQLKRVDGVGNAVLFGAGRYAMRIWLDAQKMASYGISTTEVLNAIRAQNLDAALGSIGKPPLKNENQKVEFILYSGGRLTNAEEFKNIIIKDNPQIYLKDVARVELGAGSYTSVQTHMNEYAATIGVFQRPNTNALSIRDGVFDVLESAAKKFPEGVEYTVPYDTTKFISVSISEVVKTLIEATLLVIFSVFIFLYSWRLVIISNIAIPVSIIGAFGLIYIFGFSINFFTLFGLVLAIGIVIDDAVLVVENIDRNLKDNKGLDVGSVVKKSMGEVVGPIIATTAVLCSVLIPMVFIPGISGALYKEFALSIVFAVVISAINSLTLSPALAGMFLKKGGSQITLRKFSPIRIFNVWFDKFREHYSVFIRKMIKLKYAVLFVFFLLLGATVFIFKVVPTGFLPEEDKALLIGFYTQKAGTSIAVTEKAGRQITDLILSVDGVKSVTAMDGFNFLTSSDAGNAGSLFIQLDDWSIRDKKKGEDLQSIMKNIYKKTSSVIESSVFVFNVPSISVGSIGGFDFRLLDYDGGDFNEFANTAYMFSGQAMQDPSISTMTTFLQTDFPRLDIKVNKDKAKVLGLDLSDIYSTIQVYFGSYYVNDFDRFQKISRVYVQGNKDARSYQNDLEKIYVKNTRGEMIPLSALITIDTSYAPDTITHYNLFRSINFNGYSAPGSSSGDAINAIEKLADSILPSRYAYEWSGISLQEIEAGNIKLFIFMLSLFVTYLVLSALYDSWILPFMILVPVPIVVLGALSGQYLVGLDNNVYTQIGLVLLIALSGKNGILVVEFAKELRESGLSIVESALKAAKLRLRPILMTSFAFIFGVLPLVFSSGAGAITRKSVGTAVFGGMITATFVSIILVPVAYVVLETIREKFVDIHALKAKRDKI